jgi:hypothetical protein
MEVTASRHDADAVQMTLLSNQIRDSATDSAGGCVLDHLGSIPLKQDLTLGPTRNPVQCVILAPFLGAKRPKRETEYSLSSTIEVKNGGDTTSRHHTYQ